MKILFIGTLPDPITGQSLACRVLLEGLEKEHEVAVVDMGKASFRQGVSSLGRVWEVLKIIAAARRRRGAADVVYLTIAESRAGNAKDLLLYAACFSRLDRMVIHLHGGAGLRPLLARRNRLTRAVNRFFLRRLGGVVVLGERHVDIFDGLVARERIHIVPNFAEDELFIDEAAIEEKFGRLAPLRLLFLSNLLPGKGHRELVDAYAALTDEQRRTIEIDFAGGFESDAARAEFLRRIEGFPGIRYHGTVRGGAKRDLLWGAHVFCLPTYYPYEGQPISILEAYASGCAVITTDHSGIFDVFEPGENGLAVEKRSVESLARALATLAADPGSLGEIAHANLRHARENFRIPHFVESLSGLLRRIAY